MAESFVAAPETERVRPDPFAREKGLTPTPPRPLGSDLQLQGETSTAQPSLAEKEAAAESERQLVSEVNRKFQDWRNERQQHEPQWYINAAFFRGNHNVTWSNTDNGLRQPFVQPQRSRRQINRIFAKIRARRAKFLKNRPTWVVVPATTDIKDKLDARYTGKVLDYIWRKLRLEAKFAEALIWAETCSRGYWWFSWNPDALGRVVTTDPATQAKSIQEGVVGEVMVEVGSPFELLVGDPSIASLSGQDEIIRAKVRTLEYVRANFPEKGEMAHAEGSGDTFQYETSISQLNTNSGLFGGGTTATSQDRKRDFKGNPNTVVVKEYFCRPNAEYPKGRYAVIANDILLKMVDELPFGFWDLENPFPCVEFVDVPSAGQYWGTTVLEQLIDLQREYNGIRSMVSANIKLTGHPKIFVAKQHQIPEGAWTPDAGEIIEYNARPGIKEPFVWDAPNIAADAWRMIELLRTEFDDITQIYPAAEGKDSGAESGFHANLLQEAADLVHGPEIRAHELAIEEAAIKIRRIIKHGYAIERLITVTSGSYQPEAFEFSAEDVDEYADIVVQAGSALPLLKGARIQAALDLYAKGVLGDPADPEVRRRLLNVLDMGGMEDIYEYQRIDEDMINIENGSAEDGVPLAQPRFFEDHQKHWIGHVNKLKTPAVLSWTPEARMELLAHAILHAKYINHAAAYQMAIEAGMPDLIPPPMMMGMALPPGMAPGPGMPGGAPMPPPGAEGDPAAPPGAGGASPDHTFNEAPDVSGAAGTPAAGPVT
jgi:hypothetical protein